MLFTKQYAKKSILEIYNKEIKEHFERAFQQCAEIYIRRKKFWDTKNIFDLSHLTLNNFETTLPKLKKYIYS